MKMAAPAVRAFAQANSFDEARKHWERIKRIPPQAWTADMALEATSAARTNGQLAHCITPSEGPLPGALEILLRQVFPRAGTSAAG
jgi:hypothetical protein